MWRPITLAVFSAIAGAVLGGMADVLLQTESQILGAIGIVVSLMAVGLFAMLLAHDKSAHTLAGQLTALKQDLSLQIEMVSQQYGLSVDRVMLAEIAQLGRMEDDRTAQRFLSAQKELLVLDVLSEGGHWPTSALPEEYSRTFFDSLVAHVEEDSSSLVYKRIIQVEDMAEPFRHATTESVREHCQEMVRLRREKGPRVALFVAAKRMPLKFIIIDETTLILQLLEYDDEKRNLRIWQELAVSDPRGDLVSAFRLIWTDIEQRSRLVEQPLDARL
ncbi:hypothetical protein Acor_05630 [Acrocarpospora corrugata]|uniref:Uncharacterized protein n=1 Tax=Acrocarpospora corrugata TaxID=35763 RepID=A0A5M3VSA5_9ACTN|nr:hypothetical protein Acor_05630 [Acrocarpospora corrugata]